MNLTILPGAATEDAEQIDSIIEEIDQNMQDLNTVIKRVIPEGVETDWALTYKENWESYYNGSIQGAMEEMKQSAKNLRKAVQAALEYTK